MAWQNWSYLYHQGDRSDEVAAAVLRLAPWAEDAAVMLELWQQRLAGRSAKQLWSAAEQQELFDLYETLGQASAGSRYFEARYRQTGQLELLDRAAQLADRVGEDERALSLYRERLQQSPFSLDACLRATTFLLRRDRAGEAYELLLAHQAQALAAANTTDTAEFWQLLLNLSFELNRLQTAEQALRQLDATRLATQNANWLRLVEMIHREQPERAAELAQELFRRNHQPELFLLAFAHYVEAHQVGLAQGLLASVNPDVLSRLENLAQFLRLRARLMQLQGKPDLAWQDLQHARRLAPEDDAVRLASLWFLLDEQRWAELQPLLQRLTQHAKDQPDYWLVFAAAYHGLDDYKRALEWYRKELKRRPDDALLLLNYADALERVQQSGMAARLRRHAWLKLREQFAGKPLQAPFDAQSELLAYVRLRLQNVTAEEGAQLVRQIVAQLRELPVAGRLTDNPATAEQETWEIQIQDQQTRDLVLAWAISRELSSQAKEWMWRSQLARLSRSVEQPDLHVENYQPPAWGQAQTALQLADRVWMDKLLQGGQQRADMKLPVYNRYDTAYALGHRQLALDTAFRGMDLNAVDEELHDRYRQHVPDASHYVQLGAERADYGLLASRQNDLTVHLHLASRLQLDMSWQKTRQNSQDVNLSAPKHDRLSAARLSWQLDRGQGSLDVARHGELHTQTAWRLVQDWTWDSRVQFQAALAAHGEATESLPLRVMASQDQLQLGAHYRLGRREYLGTR